MDKVELEPYGFVAIFVFHLAPSLHFGKCVFLTAQEKVICGQYTKLTRNANWHKSCYTFACFRLEKLEGTKEPLIPMAMRRIFHR